MIGCAPLGPCPAFASDTFLFRKAFEYVAADSKMRANLTSKTAPCADMMAHYADLFESLAKVCPSLMVKPTTMRSAIFKSHLEVRCHFG